MSECIKWFMSRLCKWYNGRLEKERGYFEKFWPELVRVFILFNYFYFTYFLFSLLWNFIRHSVLRKKSYSRLENFEEPACTKSRQKNQKIGQRRDKRSERSKEKNPQFRILNSLQKLKQYNESFLSFWKNQLDFFYTNLLNVYFLCSNKICTDGMNSVPDHGKRGYNEAAPHNVMFNKVSILKKTFEKQNEYDKSLFYSAYNVQTRNDNIPFVSHNKQRLTTKDGDKSNKNIKSNYDKLDAEQSLNNQHASEYSVIMKHCSNSYKIKMKKCKHNLIKHQTERRKISDDSCKVIYYGPYASSRKTDVIRQNVVSKDNSLKKCTQKIPDKKIKHQKDRRNSTHSIKRTSKHKIQLQNTAMIEKQKKKTCPKKEVKNQYFSEDDPPISNKSCSGVTIPGVPLSMIDPNDKNFMTNSSVKYVYKKILKQNGMNHTFVDMVANVIRGVSKSIKRDRQCSLKLGRLP